MLCNTECMNMKKKNAETIPVSTPNKICVQSFSQRKMTEKKDMFCELFSVCPPEDLPLPINNFTKYCDFIFWCNNTTKFKYFLEKYMNLNKNEINKKNFKVFKLLGIQIHKTHELNYEEINKMCQIWEEKIENYYWTDKFEF